LEKFITPIVLLIIVIAFFYFRSNLSSDAAKENIKIGLEFLTLNKNKEGIFETKSGLQYQILNRGEGELHPSTKDRVKVHYHGTLLDGTVFDSSVDRGEPISFGLNQVIPGWTEGVQLMSVGDKTRFFIPANLAYGNRSTGKIESGSLLIFEIELLGINE